MKRAEICEVLIVLCAIVNTYLFANRLWLPYVDHKHTYIHSYVGDDFPEHLPLDRPARAEVPMTIQHLPEFSISGPGADEKWETIDVLGYGYVRLGDQARLLCVAMFHGLHCIEKMRIYLDDPGRYSHAFPHQHHCINYLRQSFLCKGDTTLEPITGLSDNEALDPDVDLSLRSGAGVTHSCGDWEAIYTTVGDNYAGWKASWNISSPWDTDERENMTGTKASL